MSIPASPYPRSNIIKGIRWITEPLRYAGSNGDAWSCIWADDGHLYSTADDCTGIEESNNSNLALFRVEGMPPSHKVSLVNPMDAYGGACYHDHNDSWKDNGLICVDGVLYMAVSQHSSALEYGDLVQRTYDASIINPSRKCETKYPSSNFATAPA